MPIITPLNDDSFDDIEEDEPLLDPEYIKQFLDIPNKKCPNCGSVNFGRNKKCPYNYKGWYCGYKWPE